MDQMPRGYTDSKESSDIENEFLPGLMTTSHFDSFCTPPKNLEERGASQDFTGDYNCDSQKEKRSDHGWLPLYASSTSKPNSFSTEAPFTSSLENCFTQTPPANYHLQVSSVGRTNNAAPNRVIDSPTGQWGPVGGRFLSKMKSSSPEMTFKSLCRPVDILTISCLERQCSQMGDLDGFVYEVRFKRSCRYFLRSKIDSLAPAQIHIGCYVNVEADRGQDVGLLIAMTPLTEFVARSGKTTAGGGRIRHDEKRVLRASTEVEVDSLHEKTLQEEGVVQYIQNLCKQRDMPLTIVDAEFQFDNAKLTIFYEATTYVIFQQLVREVYKVYKTRIWLEQIGGPGSLTRDSRSSSIDASNHRSILNVDAPIFSQQQTYSSADILRPQGVVTPERADEPGMAATAMAAGMAAQAMQATSHSSRKGSLANDANSSVPPTSRFNPKPAMEKGVFSPSFICPITQDIMIDPVICSDGHKYDRAAIVAWLKHSDKSPITRCLLLNKDLQPDDKLRIQIDLFRETRLEERLKRLIFLDD